MTPEMPVAEPQASPQASAPPAEASSPVLPELAPVTASERLATIDTLRGVALLGILLLNINAFALPEGAYFNPRVAGGHTGASLTWWLLSWVIWDGKMRGIFSLVFGASVILLTTRAEQRTGGISAADLHYRRTLWLMLFGIAHAFLIWWGDILYPYALVGLILFPLRKLSPKALLITAGIQIVLLTGMSVGFGFMLKGMRDEAAAADAAAAKGAKLTEEQQEAQRKWKERLKGMNPPPEEIKKENDAYRGNYLQALKRRAATVSRWHSLPYYSPKLWDMMAFMLIGMAFIKNGVLSGQRSTRFYSILASIGYGVGLPLFVYSGWRMIQQNFDPILSTFESSTYQIGRLAVMLAHISVVLIVIKSGALQWLTSRLAAVGQMAFSNYISTSVICTLIFYGYGFGAFNRLQRWQLYPIVLAIWTFQIVVSPIWLRHFRYGPLEWCWRSLTYWKKQPMRLGEPAAVLAAPAAPAAG